MFKLTIFILGFSTVLIWPFLWLPIGGCYLVFCLLDDHEKHQRKRNPEYY